jgi:hypothetical protein
MPPRSDTLRDIPACNESVETERAGKMNKWRGLESATRRANVAFCEGYRASTDVRYPPKQEAAAPRAELWGFRFSSRYGSDAPLGGTASAGRSMAWERSVPCKCRPGLGLEMVAGATGAVAGASSIVAGSIRLSARGEVEPCRVMTWSSRSVWWRKAVRAAGASARRPR